MKKIVLSSALLLLTIGFLSAQCTIDDDATPNMFGLGTNANPAPPSAPITSNLVTVCGSGFSGSQSRVTGIVTGFNYTVEVIKVVSGVATQIPFAVCQKNASNVDVILLNATSNSSFTALTGRDIVISALGSETVTLIYRMSCNSCPTNPRKGADLCPNATDVTTATVYPYAPYSASLFTKPTFPSFVGETTNGTNTEGPVLTNGGILSYCNVPGDSDDDDVWYTIKAPASGKLIIRYTNLSTTSNTTSSSSPIQALKYGLFSSCTVGATVDGCFSAAAAGTTEKSYTGLSGGQQYLLRIWTLGTTGKAAANFYLFDPDVAAPVELTTFEAQKKGYANRLDWKTASESNNDRFEIERSFNGKSEWTKIGSVKGNGTSTLANNYSFNDETPLSISYYRLKQMDFDGKAEYSKVVSVVGGKADKFKIASVLPNPFKDVATIVFDSNKEDNVTVTLMDVTGRVVLLKNVACTEGGNALTLDLAALSSGIYIVSLRSSDGFITQKIVKN